MTDTLLRDLRAELPTPIRRREAVTLRAVRGVIGAIENAEVSYLTDPVAAPLTSDYIAGDTRFCYAERVVRELSDEEMIAIARDRVEEHLAEAARLRSLGQVDQALMIKAEALAINDRIEAHRAAVDA